MRPWLLLLLAVAAVLSSLTESRTVSKHELKRKLAMTLSLPHRLWKFRKWIVNTIVCELARKTHLKTDFKHVLGYRKTTTVRPTTKMTTNTNTMATPPTTTDMATTPYTTATTMATPLAYLDEQGSGSGMAMEDRTNEEENKFDETEMMRDDNSNDGESDEEGSGSGMTMEDTTNEEENKFDETEMMRNDNSNDGESNEEGLGFGMTMEDMMNEEENKCDETEMMQDDNNNDGESDEEETGDWSLGYYGIFKLSDSHFCQSGYRWSRNVCRTSCTNFTDEDITDDLNCVILSGWWRCLMRTATYRCKNLHRG